MTKALLILFTCFVTFFVQGETVRDTLLVGYSNAPPFVNQTEDGIGGINAWLWERVAKNLDLHYELIALSFPDMLDSVKTGSIDVAINPLTITSARSKHMEFTHSFYASNSTVAVAELSSFQKFTQFFKGFFNFNFIKGFLVLLAIIFLFGFAGWYFEKRANPEHFRSGYKGIWDGLWWSAVTLTTVGYGDKAPKSRFGKIAALLLMFTGLLFISGLTASIASNLTVNQLINDTDSFVKFKERKVGSVKSTGTLEFLKSHFFTDIKGYENVGKGLSALKNKEIHAFMYDEPILKYLILQDSSLQKIQILPIQFDVQFYAFALSKQNSALEQAISQNILEIIEGKEWEIVLNEFGLSEL